ncbi:MAG: response regulator [Thermodesulfovibrionales bacterium]|jgi:two-component system chemotaxis response regulator CheY
MKIMIVDDCMTTRKLIGIYLKAKGFEIVFAENGLDAMEKLATNKINMIITDLNMPYMDGIELIKNLKADPNCASIPILMVTTEADPQERERAMAAGADGYAIKPVTADMVTQNIKDILKNFFGDGGVSDA